jgi:hypothetical protein
MDEVMIECNVGFVIGDMAGSGDLKQDLICPASAVCTNG